jgi:hypothetical protein
MGMLKEGDKVQVHVKDHKIVSPYDEYHHAETLEIVATDMYGYYLYVPHHRHLSGSNVVDIYRCRQLGIDPRFANEQVIYITANLVADISKTDGMCCQHCGDFVMMAEPNQLDGKSFWCWSCRQNPWR